MGEGRRPSQAGVGGCGGRRHTRLSRGSVGGYRWRVSVGEAAAATYGCQVGMAAAAIVGGIAGKLWQRPPLADVGGCGGRRHTRVSRGSGGGQYCRCRGRAPVAAAIAGGSRRVRRPPPHTGVKGEWRRPLLAGVRGCRGRRQTRVSRASRGGRCWQVSACAAAAARHGCLRGVAAAVAGGCPRLRRPPQDTGVKGEWRRPLLAVVGAGGGRRHTWSSRGSCGGRCWRASASAVAAARHECLRGVAAAFVGGCPRMWRPPQDTGVKGEWRWPLSAGVGAGGGRRHTWSSRGSCGGRCWRVSASAAAAARHGCLRGVGAAVVCGCRRVRRPPPHMIVKGEWRRPLFVGVGWCGGRRHTWLSRGSGGGRCWRVSAGAEAAATHGCQGGVAAAVVGGCWLVRWPPPHMVVMGEWRQPLLAGVGGCRGRRQTRVSRKSGGGRCWQVSADAAVAPTHWGQRGVAAAVVGGSRLVRRLAPHTGVKGGWRRPLLAGVGWFGGR